MSREIVDAYPLTPLQKGMLYEVMANPDANLFIGSASFDFRGDLENSRFRGAWQSAVKLHPVLRTQFIWDGVEEPLQLVLDDCEIEMELIDCSAISLENRNSHTAQLRLAYRRTRIEADQCPLMFLKLIQWSDSEYTLIWQVHHLVMDAWSASIVFKSVLELYQGNNKLPELQANQLLSFSDYVQHLNSSDVDESKNYWKQYLKSVDKSDLNVPAPIDQHSRLSDEAVGQSEDILNNPKQAVYCINECVWDQQKSRTVKEFCSANSITLAGFIHGAWAILVSAYSNTKVPYFGSVASGRYSGIQGIDSAVGLFINTLPFYARLDSERTIVQWIEEIQTQLQRNQKYGQLGLQDIKQHLALGPESSVFDTVVSIEPELLIDEIESIDSDLRVQNIQFAVDSDIPLSMIFDPKDQFKVELSFNPSIVHQSTVEQMQVDFLFVVDEIISGPAKTSDEILLSLQKKYQLGVQKPVSTSANDACSTDEYTGVASWLNQTSRQCGSTVAIQSTQSAVDYSQFAVIVNSIGYQLRDALVQDSVTSDSKSQGLPDNTPLVGVCITSVWQQVIAYFGVLDAELTYVPLDPTVSDERLKKILSKSQCRFVLTEKALASRFDDLDIIALNIDDILESGDATELQGSPELHDDVSSASSLEKTAYVMYTSGSTGEPKGVMVSHANLIYSTQARIVYYQDKQPRFMLLSPTVFDSSVVGIYWTLLGGGSLIVPERDEVKDVQLIAKLIEQHKVDTILCLPTYYRLLLDGAGPRQLSTLKRVILAGESCSEAIVDLHYQSIPNAELFNEYGPTECTVWSSVARLERDQSPVTIGRAIPGTAINIVDEQGCPVPIGTMGEIVVSGPGVACGYLFDDLETSKRFYSRLPAFDEANAYKSYRTGDLGSFTAEQQLLFHGRIDRQIKIRGHRIEPAEIENVAISISAVGECVAIGVPGVRPDDGAEVSLKNTSRMIPDALFTQIAVYLTMASVSSGNEQDRGHFIDPVLLCEEVLHRIQSSLPAYMHPAQVLVIDGFPKTATDKVDVNGMQTCEILAQASKTKARASNSEATPSELDTSSQRMFNQLESIAEEVLQVSHILADDTFNELGGDSISAIIFVSRARERGLSCDIRQLVGEKSFGVIAGELAEIESTSDNVNDTISSFGPTKLTPIQQWYFSLQNPKPAHWNLAYRITLDHEIKISDLSESLTNTLNRFPAIGSRFTNDASGWNCVIPDSLSGAVPITTLAAGVASSPQVDAVLLQMAESWELEKGWMVGFIIIENQPGFTNEMYLMAHHLVLDHIAVSLFIRHIFADAGYLTDSDRSAATEPMSLRQYSLTASETQCAADDSRWKALVNDASNEPQAFTTEGRSNYYSISLNEKDTNELVQAADAANVNLLEVLVTVLSFIWRRNTSEQSVAELDLYIETSGRELPLDDQDVSDVIGWLTLFYPLDKSAINHADIYETLKGIKNSLRLYKESHYQYLNWYFQQYNDCPTQGTDNATCLINYLGDSSLLMEAEGYSVDVCNKRFLRDENAKRAFDIELNAYLSSNQLHLDWNVAENLNGVIVEDLSRDMVDEMISLANRLLESGGGPVYTPSDFSSASLSQDDLDSILRDID